MDLYQCGYRKRRTLCCFLVDKTIIDQYHVGLIWYRYTPSRLFCFNCSPGVSLFERGKRFGFTTPSFEGFKGFTESFQLVVEGRYRTTIHIAEQWYTSFSFFFESIECTARHLWWPVPLTAGYAATFHMCLGYQS